MTKTLNYGGSPCRTTATRSTRSPSKTASSRAWPSRPVKTPSAVENSADPISLKDGDEDMDTSDGGQGRSASELITERLADLGDWRGKSLARMRQLIHEAD